VTLRARTFLRSIGPFAVLVLGVCAAFSVLVVAGERRNARQLAEAKVLALSDRVADMLLRGDEAGLARLVSGAASGGGPAAYAFVERRGRVCASTFGEGVPTVLLALHRVPPPVPRTAEYRDTQGAVFYDVAHHVEPPGAVLHLGLSRGQVDATALGAVWKILGLGAAVLLFGGLLSARVAAVTTREVERMTAELRASEERHRALVENIHLGITLTDDRHRIIMVNAAAARLFGRRPEEFVGQECFRMFERRDLECPGCPSRIALETGRPAEADREAVRDDGTRFTVRTQAFPIIDPDGRSRAVIEVIEDVTDRKRQEEEIRRLSSFPKLNPNPVVEVDASGEITYFNAAAVRTLKAMGAPPDARVFLPSELPSLLDALRQGHALETRCEVQVRDHTFAEHISTAVEFRAIRIYALDVTQRRQAQEAAERENAKLSAMISGMDDGVVFANADGVIVEANACFCRLVHKPREAIVGARLEDFHQGDLARLVRDCIATFRANPGAPAVSVQKTFEATEVILRIQPICRDGRYDGVLLNVINVTELVRARQAVEEANRRLNELATTDELTGLWNRRRFMELLDVEVERVRRYATSLVLVMLDVDHFKAFNDTHGHAFGDKVLMAVAAVLRQEVRAGDVPARYAGDEFMILMPNTSAAEAERAADRIRRRLAAQPVTDGRSAVAVTLSVGIAASGPRGTLTRDGLLRAADAALYAAKHAGRNTTRRDDQAADAEKETPTRPDSR